MREASTIMADLAAAGLDPAQLALVMELAVAVAAEARPQVEHEVSDSTLRMRRKRAREAAERHKASQSVTCDGDVTQKEALPLSPLEPPITPTREKIPRARKGRVTGDGARPGAWQGRGKVDRPSGSGEAADRPDGLAGGAGPIGFAKPGEAAPCAEIRRLVHAAVGEPTYRSWFDPPDFAVAGDRLRVTTRTKFAADWIRNTMLAPLQAAAGRTIGKSAKVEVTAHE